MTEKLNYSLPAPIRKIINKAFGGSASNIFKGMATLALGSGAAKIIGIAAIPILTRLYSPEDFGVLAVFTALILILSPLLTLRYDLALPLPRHDGMALNLLVLSAGAMISITLLFTIILWLSREQILTVFAMEILSTWWWLIAIGSFAAASYEMLTLWATRKRNYKVIAKTRIWQTTMGAAVKIALGLLALKPLGLLVGQVVTQGGGTGSLLQGFKSDFIKNWRHVSWPRVKFVGWWYRSIPIYGIPSRFLMTFSIQAPLIFIAVLYDANTTGQLGLALMAVGLPSQIFGRTLAKAFYAEAANVGRQNPDKVREMAISVMKRLVVFSIPPALILLMFGPVMFSVFFGESWQLAGVFSSILAVYLVFQFVQSPVTHIFYIFDGQKALFYLNLQRMGLVVLCFTAAYFYELIPETTILIYSVLLSIHYLLSTVYALRYIPESKSKN